MLPMRILLSSVPIAITAAKINIECAMLCLICPTATAAAVVTRKLGGDVAGITATKNAIEMFKYKATQWVINFEEGQDPGNCEIEVLQNLYKNKEKVR